MEALHFRHELALCAAILVPFSCAGSSGSTEAGDLTTPGDVAAQDTGGALDGAAGDIPEGAPHDTDAGSEVDQGACLGRILSAARVVPSSPAVVVLSADAVRSLTCDFEQIVVVTEEFDIHVQYPGTSSWSLLSVGPAVECPPILGAPRSRAIDAHATLIQWCTEDVSSLTAGVRKHSQLLTDGVVSHDFGDRLVGDRVLFTLADSSVCFDGLGGTACEDTSGATWFGDGEKRSLVRLQGTSSVFFAIGPSSIIRVDGGSRQAQVVATGTDLRYFLNADFFGSESFGVAADTDRLVFFSEGGLLGTTDVTPPASTYSVAALRDPVGLVYGDDENGSFVLARPGTPPETFGPDLPEKLEVKNVNQFGLVADATAFVDSSRIELARQDEVRFLDAGLQETARVCGVAPQRDRTLGAQNSGGTGLFLDRPTQTLFGYGPTGTFTLKLENFAFGAEALRTVTPTLGAGFFLRTDDRESAQTSPFSEKGSLYLVEQGPSGDWTYAPVFEDFDRADPCGRCYALQRGGEISKGCVEP